MEFRAQSPREASFHLGYFIISGVSGDLSPLLMWSWLLGSGGELLDGTVIVLGGESLQGAPAVCMKFDDLHEQRAGQGGFGRTKHLIPHGC